MVTLTRISKSEVKFISDSSREFMKVRKRLTFFIDGAIFSEDFKEGNWNGLKKFYRGKNIIAYGLTKFLIEILEEEGVKYELKNFERFKPSIDISQIVLSPGLRPQQIEATKVFFDNFFGPFGIIEMPTRGGKTFTASETIRIAGIFGYNRSLFFVDGSDLFRQTIREFSKFFKIPEKEIGALQGAEAFDFKEINVAMIQTFTSILYPKKTKKVSGKEQRKTKEEIQEDERKKRLLTRKIYSVKYLIIDEIQEYMSMKRLGTIRRFKNAELMMSLSATPFKSEASIKNIKLREVVGDVIHKVNEEELIKNGSLVKNFVLIILFRSEKKLGDNFNHYIEQNIIFDKDRNKLVIDLARTLDKLRLKSLFMVQRKKHGNLLSKETGFQFVSGDDKSDEREIAKEKFLEAEHGILFASDIYKKGVSLDNCLVLVNVSGGLEKSTIIQKRGRVLAATEGKEAAVVVDIFDEKEYFSEHSLNRLEGYTEKVPEENIIVLDYAEEGFLESFENFMKEVFYGKKG